MDEKKIGFISPVITEEHFILGGLSSLPANVIRVDGDWTPYLPVFESQLEQTFDSDGCTVYGTLNAIETLQGGLSNYSRRFLYNEVGIVPPGSDPHLVATTIRGSGLVNEEDLPDETLSLSEFMSPRPNSVDTRVKGQQWLNKQQLGHEWVLTPSTSGNRLNLLKQALLYSPVCISVCAWYKNDKGLFYSPPGEQNAHWCMCYKIDDSGIYVFDSYRDAQTGSNLKKLTLDHNIQYAKRYSLMVPTQQQNWFVQLIIAFLELVGLKQKQVEKKTMEQRADVVTPTITIAQPKYIWDDFLTSRHSVRVICDEEGLTLDSKNIICACIQQESNFNNKTVNRNKNSKGDITSSDWGICQINDYYQIGVGKPFSSVDEVTANPDKAVRFMITMMKAGKLHLWVSYSSGAYKKYL